MLALCSMLLHTYYAHFNAGIIRAPLPSGVMESASVPVPPAKRRKQCPHCNEFVSMGTFYWHKRTFLGDDEDESGDQSDNESAEELDSGSQTDDKLLGNIRELNFITLALRLHYNKHKTVCILCIGTEPDCSSIGDSEVNDTIFENSEHSSCELEEEVRKCLQPSTWVHVYMHSCIKSEYIQNNIYVCVLWSSFAWLYYRLLINRELRTGHLMKAVTLILIEMMIKLISKSLLLLCFRLLSTTFLCISFFGKHYSWYQIKQSSRYWSLWSTFY